MPNVKIEKSIIIPEGEYSGIIKENKVVDYGDYTYHDTFIEIETEGNPVIKLGVPFGVTKNTLLGKILMRFGADLNKAGTDINTDDFLKPGRKIKCLIYKKTGADGVEYTKVNADTLRPE